jgi:hypothetical protein
MNTLRSSLLLPLLLLLLSTGIYACATAPEVATNTYTLNGKTRYQGKSLSSGEVLLIRAEPGGTVYKAAIGEEGVFNIDLPPGPYLLMGSGSDPVSGKDLFAFWTNNPVQLYGDIPDPVILPFVTATATPQIIEGQGIRGRVLLEGKPVIGAVVAIFLDANGDFHGLPFQESTPTGVDGKFYLDAQPGKYFVLARSKASGNPYQGPLLKGDQAGFYPHNPVVLRTGQGLVLDIPTAQVNRPRGEGSLAHGESIIVQGQVTIVTGEAAHNVRVVLYNVPEMLGRPAFISSPTDDHGSFRLEVSRSGKFYAAARSVIGRPPETGELMGFYDGTEDHSLTLQWGDRLEGVDIVVREIW